MYLPILALHSLLRWVVLAAGLLAVGRAAAGARSRAAWTSADESAARWFVIALDVQVLLGLALYVWLSPMTQVAFQDFGSAMRNPALRFFAVEHLVGMVAAVALAHIGRARLRRATDAARRHRTALIFFGLAILVVLLTIPWPGMPAARPLFRLP